MKAATLEELLEILQVQYETKCRSWYRCFALHLLRSLLAADRPSVVHVGNGFLAPGIMPPSFLQAKVILVPKGDRDRMHRSVLVAPGYVSERCSQACGRVVSFTLART